MKATINKAILTRRRIISSTLILLVLLLVFGSCGPTQTGEDTITTTNDKTGDTTQNAEFNYPDIDFNKEVFTILNCSKDQWNMIANITAEQTQGDGVNDAIRKRQLKVEDMLNCTIKEVNVSVYDLKTTLLKDISSGDSTYAAAYQRADECLTGILDGSYLVLDELDNLSLDKSYWFQDFLNATSLAGKNYMAISNIQLMAFDGVWAIFFNKDLLESKHIEAPYDLVRSGKWTIDELHRLSAEMSSLNSDDSWAWNVKGTSVYGYTTFTDGIAKLLYGIEGFFGDKDNTDLPVLSVNSPGFVDRALRLSSFCGDDGAYLYSKANGENGYEAVFMNQRAAFVGAEIKFGRLLRSVSFDYGILPYPKYNENQDSYRSTTLHLLPVVTIPSSNPEPEKIALVLDALSYESDNYVIRPYYDERVSLRSIGGTQNDIDMLNIIRNNIGYDIFIMLGLSTDLRLQITYNIGDGETTVSSVIAKYLSPVLTKLTELRSSINK
ncbi:MAG: hypothetical protein GX303_04240 [Clostridiales bacterium]|nr:hypothetical protein [Clostridiales bacterium]